MAKDPIHITIVGGGMSAFFCIRDLYEKMAEWPKSMLPQQIEIIEAGDKFAAGIAWDPDNIRPFHGMNTYVPPESNLIATAQEHFSELLKHKPAGEVSRLLLREHSKRAFDETIKQFEAKGVRVKRSPHTIVENIEKDEDGFHLTTSIRNPQNNSISSGPQKTTDYVVLATGHWQGKSGTDDNKGVFASPWPAKRLEDEIDFKQPVAVMGTSLSAVDALLTMAHHEGTFEHNKDGKVVFKANNPNSFHIVAYSPNGMLPSVLGASETDSKMREGLPDRNSLREGNFIPLDRVFKACSQHFLEKYEAQESNNPEFKAIKAFLEKDRKIEDAVSAVYQIYARDPKGFIRQQLDAAKDSRRDDKPIFWQEYLRSVVFTLEGTYNHFSAEDQERFLHTVRPLYAKLAYGMVMSNAEEILALYESGHLEVKALGQNSSLGTKQDSAGKKLPGAEIRYMDSAGKEHHDYFPAVVKAWGDDLYRLKDSSNLMKNMFKSGIIDEYCVPYSNQEKGRAEFEREKTETIKTMRLIDGVYCRSNGGIKINPATYEAVPHKNYAETSGNLFAIGEALSGYKPLFHGFGAMSAATDRIVDTIAGRIMEKRLSIKKPEGCLMLKASTTNHIMAVVKPDAMKNADKIRIAVAKSLDVPAENINVVSTEDAPLMAIMDLVANRLSKL